MNKNWYHYQDKCDKRAWRFANIYFSSFLFFLIALSYGRTYEKSTTEACFFLMGVGGTGEVDNNI